MKYLKDFGYNDWKELVIKNHNLEQKLFNYAMDNANFMLDDYLYHCKGCDYSIDSCGYSYFKILDIPTAIGWLEDLKKSTPLLCDSDFAKAQKLYERWELLDYVEHCTNAKDKDIENLENSVDKLQKEVEDAILQTLKGEYDSCYNTDRLVDFIDFVLDDVDFSTTYMKEDGELVQYNPGYYVPTKIIPGHYVAANYEKVEI